jgi:hypothetical protein
MSLGSHKAKKIVDIRQVDSAEQLNESLSRSAQKKQGRSKLAVGIMAVLLVLALGFGGFMYWKYRDISGDPSTAITEKNQEETTRVLDGLKKRLLISETDAPTVARVEEPEKLKKSNTEFYKDIVKGDYLIIFPKRAVIYREELGQIINIAPIINTSELKKTTETPTEPTKEKD